MAYVYVFNVFDMYWVDFLCLRCLHFKMRGYILSIQYIVKQKWQQIYLSTENFGINWFIAINVSAVSTAKTILFTFHTKVEVMLITFGNHLT